MKQTFQIDIKHQVKSISNGLWNIGLLTVALIFLWLFMNINPFEPFLIFGLLLWTLFWFIPAIILHPVYYLLNRKTELIYNKEKKEFEIIQDKKTSIFKSGDIKLIERIYYSDYRLPKWQQNYIPMPWKKYGLIRIVTNEDKEFFLTSLMIDIINPPIDPTINTYRFIPFPPQTISQKRNELKKTAGFKRNQVEKFKIEFSGLTISELSEKTVENGLIEEAEIAANELITERNTTANSKYIT